MLKQILVSHRITLAELGQAVRQSGGSRKGQPFGRAAMCRLANRLEFPKSTPEAEVRRQVEDFLQRRGVAPVELKSLWTAVATPSQPNTKKENDIMLPRKSSLSPQAKTVFGISRSPFGDVTSDHDMFLSPDIRDAREALMGTMREGGFIALVGESGAGKTTLMEECEEQIRRAGLAITVIRPPICGMDTDKEKGSVLRARNILNFITDVIAPNAKRAVDTTRFSWQVQRHLANELAQGRRCVLVIDDAHRLNRHTLNHLKDLYEFKQGRQRLLGICLMGQPYLGIRLDPANPDLVQVAQRCDIVHLKPMGEDVREYLKTRLRAIGADPANILADDAYEAIRARLTGTFSSGGRQQTPVSLAYPLAVNNLVIAAMNLAAQIGEKRVTAEIVGEL